MWSMRAPRVHVRHRPIARRLLWAMLAAAAAAVGCGSAPSITEPSTTAPTSTEYFTGTLTPGGSAFYSFTVSNAGTANITLASTTTAKVGGAVSVPLRMGIGVPYAQGCATVQTVDT